MAGGARVRAPFHRRDMFVRYVSDIPRKPCQSSRYAMTKTTQAPKDCATGGLDAGAGEAPRRRRIWREDPPREHCDPDDDAGMSEIDLRPMGAVYAARGGLFDAVREIKERLRRKR
jgi:hypothetical protein